MEVVLEEYEIVVIVRTGDGDPWKWDFTDLLDMNTGIGEQAWVEKSTLRATGTEEELDER